VDEPNDSQVLIPKLSLPLEPGLRELFGGLRKEERTQQQADEENPQQSSQHYTLLSDRIAVSPELCKGNTGIDKKSGKVHRLITKTDPGSSQTLAISRQHYQYWRVNSPRVHFAKLFN